MKRLVLTIAAVVLTVAANLSPAAAAEGPKWSGNNTIVSDVPARAPHYEWQYGYVGNHPRYEAHWVLVP
jgi:hypothetical protein